MGLHVHGHGHDHGHDHPHDHDHGHEHPHAPRPRGESSRRALLAALILNGAFLVIEAGVGFWTGSLVLLSDAAHMVSDVAALILALVAAYLVLRPPTPKRTFGLLRAEVLGAFVNAVILVVACVGIFKEATERLLGGPPPVPGLPVILVAAAGLAINLGSAWFLWRSASNDMNVRGALVHMLADALGSLGALVAGVAMTFFGWTAADAVVSLLIGAMVLWGAWGILRDSTRVLLDFAPPGLGQDVLLRALERVEGIASVHDVHVWSLGGGQTTVTAHIVACEGATPYDVLRRAEEVLRAELNVSHSTLQIDPATGACAQVECTMLREGA